MNIIEFQRRNEEAKSLVDEFRSRMAPGEKGLINARFHRYKNRYPYFGPVEGVVVDHSFVMMVANDDLVALTYFWYGDNSYEPTSLGLWVRLVSAAKQVFDVGAFSGVYALAAASVSSSVRVWAFEPTRRTYGRLLMNVQANGFSNSIVTVNRGVSDRVGVANIIQFRGENILGNGASLFMKPDRTPTSQDEVVHLTTLDTLVDEEGVVPDLIKIDVETAEECVLKGGLRLLEDHGPNMLVEVTKTTVQPVVRLLESVGYSCFLVREREGGLQPSELGRVAGTCNMLCTRSPDNFADLLLS